MTVTVATIDEGVLVSVWSSHLDTVTHNNNNNNTFLKKDIVISFLFQFLETACSLQMHSCS